MLQIVITVIAMAMLALTAVTLLPMDNGVQANANVIEKMTLKSVPSLQAAYQLVAEANEYVIPSYVEDADGGFARHFQPVLRLLPPAPVGFVWAYGRSAVDGSAWGDTAYACLHSTSVDTMSAWTGLANAARSLDPSVVFVNASCGAHTQGPTPSTTPYPVALTVFLTYEVPEVP